MLKENDPHHPEATPPIVGPRAPEPRGHFDIDLVRAVMGTTTHQYEPIFAPVIDSTMNLASYCEREGIPVRPGLVVVAGTQTHGVGRTGAWESSAESKDITMSIVLRDTLCPKTHLLLHIASTLAVANALERAADLEPAPEGQRALFRIKLPNDVRVDCGDHFGKICGSLGVGALTPDIKADHHQRGWRYPDDAMVMGIGINLSNDVLANPGRLRFPASSLEQVTGRLFSREVVIGMVLHELDRTMTLLNRDRGALVREASLKLAVGEGGAAILDTRSGFSGPVYVHQLSADGITFFHRGERRMAPLDDVLRLYPEEAPLAD